MRPNDPRATRYAELCSKLEALMAEYGDVISWHDPMDSDDEEDEIYPPDWNHPLAIQHWTMILAVDDTNPEGSGRGYWTFNICPPTQRPYITKGLLSDWLESFP